MWRLTGALAVLIVMLALTAGAAIAEHRSAVNARVAKGAALDAKKLADEQAKAIICLNATQKARSAPYLDEFAALKALSATEADALNRINTDPQGAIAEINRAFAVLKVRLAQDDAALAAHPAGKC